MTITFYGAPRSCTFRVLWALQEIAASNGLPTPYLPHLQRWIGALTARPAARQAIAARTLNRTLADLAAATGTGAANGEPSALVPALASEALCGAEPEGVAF